MNSSNGPLQLVHHPAEWHPIGWVSFPRVTSSAEHIGKPQTSSSCITHPLTHSPSNPTPASPKRALPAVDCFSTSHYLSHQHLHALTASDRCLQTSPAEALAISACSSGRTRGRGHRPGRLPRSLGHGCGVQSAMLGRSWRKTCRRRGTMTGSSEKREDWGLVRKAASIWRLI